MDQDGAVIPEPWWESMKTLPDYDAASFETFREGLLWSPDLGRPLEGIREGMSGQGPSAHGPSGATSTS